MNFRDWLSELDRLERGGDLAELDRLLDAIPSDALGLYDLGQSLRQSFLHHTRAALRTAHRLGRSRLLGEIGPRLTRRRDCPPTNWRQKGLKTMITRKSFIIPAAAAVVIFLAGVLRFESGSGFDSRAAFAEMIERVRGANSVSFTEVEQATSTNRMTTRHTFVENPPRLRYEMAIGGLDFTMVFDGSRTYATFGPPVRMVRIGNLRPPEHVFQAARQMLETLRNYAGANAAEYIGDREVDGVACHVYRYLLSEDDPKTSWNDWCNLEIYLSAESLYPIKIVWLGYLVDAPLSEQNEPVVTRTTSDFKWNFKLEPAMFKVDVPEGWSVVELPDDATLGDFFPKLTPGVHSQDTPPEPKEQTAP